MPSLRRIGIRLAIALLLGAAAVVVDAAAAPRDVITAVAQRITPAGVGKVKLGERYTTLRAQHLAGTLRRGCPLAGPNARSAQLRGPLKGSVDLTMNLPRRVTDISIRGGATARGVGVGATIATIKAAFPKARVDHSTDHMFGITLVRIPRNGGGKLEFAVSTSTHRVVQIGIPFVPFCE